MVSEEWFGIFHERISGMRTIAISIFQETSIARCHVKCHIVHMVQITIRDLHMKTGEWVRKAADAESIVVMDRRRPVAKLVPFTLEDQGIPFGDRPMVKGFSNLPKLSHDSTVFLSEDRDRA
jgi:antitoxin (DNA-binding transcriptional repressor) of toxin-antitoxin stability system